MTTNQLIELSKSITQGEWTFEQTSKTTVDVWLQADGIRSVICQAKTDQLDGEHGGSVSANATAISLVPQLLSEVISLRNALATITQLDMPCMSQSQEAGFRTRADLDHWRIVLGGLLVQAKMTARAALANE